jgi:hypothetical protein
MWGKGMEGWMYCKYYVHKYVNGKRRPVKTVPWMGGGCKGKWWSWWIHIGYIWYILRTFVNATMYLQHNSKKKEIKDTCVEIMTPWMIIVFKTKYLSQGETSIL